MPVVPRSDFFSALFGRSPADKENRKVAPIASTTYRAQNFFFLARQHRLAYLQVPKVACTSLKTAICLLNRPDLSREVLIDPLGIHRQQEWSDMVQADWPDRPSYLTFTFVRNPYARFLSFYWSKIDGSAGKPGAGPEPRFRELGYVSGMSIDEVLDRIEATPETDMDPHILPQSAIVARNGAFQVDFIGRVERFAQDLKAVEAWAGIQLDVGELNVTKKVQTDDARQALTPDQRRRVERIYSRDFEVLKYRKDP